MRVLITGVGGPTPIGIAKSLRMNHGNEELRLIGVDASPYAPGLYNKDLFNETHLVPLASEPNYWATIEDLVSSREIDYAFIVPEKEVLIWAERYEYNPLSCKSLLPGYELAKGCYSKQTTYEILSGIENMVPRSMRVGRDQLTDEIGRTLGYPYWIRGESGAGAIGALKIHKQEELAPWISLNPGISEFMASEYLPGRNLACKLLYYNGKILRSACGERLEYLLPNAAPSGISGMCAHGRLLNELEIVEKSRLAMEAIFAHFGQEPNGMFTVDLKEDAAGVAKITEINIRHVSFSHAFAMGGANFALDTLRLLKGDPTFNFEYQAYSFETDFHFIRGVDSALFLLKESEVLQPPTATAGFHSS